MKIGDVVWLKSGGPALTVATVDEEADEVCVVWWNGSSFDEEPDMPAAMLTTTNPNRE